MEENRRQKRERRRNRRVKRQRLFISGLILAILALIFLPAQIRMWQMEGQLRRLKSQEKVLIAEQGKMQKQVDYYNSDAYVEEAARRQLGLVRPGEQPILPAVPGKSEQTPPQNKQPVTVQD